MLTTTAPSTASHLIQIGGYKLGSGYTWFVMSYCCRGAACWPCWSREPAPTAWTEGTLQVGELATLCGWQPEGKDSGVSLQTQQTAQATVWWEVKLLGDISEKVNPLQYNHWLLLLITSLYIAAASGFHLGWGEGGGDGPPWKLVCQFFFNG